MKNIEKLKKASQNYVINNKENLTNEVLNYLKERIKKNKNEIEELIKIRKEKIEYEEILSIIESELKEESELKDYIDLKINEQKFLSMYIKMPVGVIAIEAYETREVIKYLIKAIKTRNAIAISDIEYDETNIKALIVLIIKEALKKYNIDENLIMILPYEECFYENFDETIYTYDEKGILKEPKIEKKNEEDKIYVYIEDKSLEKEARQNKNAEIIEGELYETIDVINNKKAKCAIIYTKDSKKAYNFINLVHSRNVFVNSSIENIEEKIETEDMLYEYRKIIIPIPQREIEKKNEDINTEMIIKKEENIFTKIFEFLKGLFN